MLLWEELRFEFAPANLLRKNLRKTPQECFPQWRRYNCGRQLGVGEELIFELLGAKSLRTTFTEDCFGAELNFEFLRAKQLGKIIAEEPFFSFGVFRKILP